MCHKVVENLANWSQSSSTGTNNRFPLIYTSKLTSVEKCWQGLCENQTKLMTNTSNLLWKHPRKGRDGESWWKLFGFVPLPHFHWSNLFWPASFWVAWLKPYRQWGPPAGSLYRNSGEAKRGGKNQWSFLLMSLQDVVSRRPKEFFRIPADSPQASSVSQKKVRWWIYLRDSNVIFLVDNSCKQESRS